MTAGTMSLDEHFISMIREPTPDPRPFYAELRDRAPVFRTPLDFWYVTRYDLAREVMRDPASWANNPESAGHPKTEPRTWALGVWHRAFMYLDGAEHKHLRQFVGSLARPKFVETLRDLVRVSVDDQLTSLAGRTEFDFKHDFAAILPAKVIMLILGLDVAEVERFLELTHLANDMLDPFVTEETLRRADEVWGGAADVVRAAAEERRAAPRKDFLTDLVHACDADDLSEDALFSIVFFVVVAGQETTQNMLSTGLFQLFRHPEQFALLLSEPKLLPSAIEELLRYEAPPRNSVPRYATRDLTIGDQQIRRGDRLHVGYQAANHDSAEFNRPNELDIQRFPNRHLGFGLGVHHCLGAALARLELNIGFSAVFERYPSIELAVSDVSWMAGFLVRGVESLPVRV